MYVNGEENFETQKATHRFAMLQGQQHVSPCIGTAIRREEEHLCRTCQQVRQSVVTVNKLNW